MSTHEQAVREAAVTLHDAIIDARKAGLVVFWPATVDALPGIAISETKKAAHADGVAVTANAAKAKRPANRKKAMTAPAAPKPAEQVTDKA